MMYLAYSDIYYFIKKRYFYILIFLILPIFGVFLLSFSDANTKDLLISAMGLNIIENQYSAMEIMSYLYFVFFSIFFVIDIYLKDILYQLDNIFMRMSLTKWYVKKTVLFIAIMFFVKLIQYFLAISTLLILKNDVSFVPFLSLFFTDFLYTIFLQFTMLFISILSSFSKLKWVSILSILLVFFLFPKNILYFEPYQLFVVLLIIVLLFLIFMIVSKKIFERIY